MGQIHQITSQEELLLVGELIDLSVAELLILQFMLRYNTPILRKVLLETLNHTLGNEKSISSSSFYNMTKKLSERDFIISDDEKQIIPTAKAQDAINLINRLTAISSIDTMTLIEEMMPEYAGVAGLSKEGKERLLIINLEAGMDIRMFGSIAWFAKQTYIATDDHAYQTYLARGMPATIHQTRMEGGGIREPENYFDAVVILGFDCNHTYREIPTQDWLEEARRVLTPGGLMSVSSIEELPSADHFLVDAMVNNIVDSDFLVNIGQDQLLEEMTNVGIEDAAIFSHKGLLIGWGHKPA